jgi:hypothetical protein
MSTISTLWKNVDAVRPSGNSDSSSPRRMKLIGQSSCCSHARNATRGSESTIEPNAATEYSKTKAVTDAIAANHRKIQPTTCRLFTTMIAPTHPYAGATNI